MNIYMFNYFNLNPELSCFINCLFKRLGITQSNQQDPEDQVNEFLGSSIEARSIDK